MENVKVTLLNHASVIVEFKAVKLLVDPWFMGSCFEDGWGLKYDNPAALDAAGTCTHLWISHFHSDHFHPVTLKRLLEVNPSIRVLGNHSYNFKLDQALQKIGFKDVVALGERRIVPLGEDFTVERIPTTGIDNMLIIRTSQGTILDFNDCNIPLRARRIIARKIGKVDLILNNFNHAGKLMDFPARPDAEVKEYQRENFRSNYAPFDPRHVIPFASYHYYRAPESRDQNGSLLGLDDLLDMDSRILPVRIGDTVVFSDRFAAVRHEGRHPISTHDIQTATQERRFSFGELAQAAQVYLAKLRGGFLGLVRLLPELDIWVSDLGLRVRLSGKKGLEEMNGGRDGCHIAANSESLHKWFSKPYGTDSFVVGAHFEITRDSIPIKWQTLISLLIENRLDLVSLLKMGFSVEGIRFLWNRKDEIVSILMSRHLTSSAQR